MKFTEITKEKEDFEVLNKKLQEEIKEISVKYEENEEILKKKEAELEEKRLLLEKPSETQDFEALLSFERLLLEKNEEIDHYKEEISCLNDKIKGFMEEMAKTKENHEKSTESTIENERKHKEITILLQEKTQLLSEKTLEIENFLNKIENLELDLQEIRVKNEVFIDKISHYQESLEAKNLEFLSLNEKTKQLTEKNKEITDKLEEITAKNKEITDKNKEFIDKEKEFTDKIKGFSDKEKEFTDRIHEFTDQTKTLERMITELSSEISTLHYQLELRECEKNNLETQANNMLRNYEQLFMFFKENPEENHQEELEKHEKMLKKYRHPEIEKRGSLAEMSNFIGNFNENSEFIRDFDLKSGQIVINEEEMHKLKQEIQLKEEVLLKKTEEFYCLQNSMKKENLGFKEEINKLKGFEEFKDKFFSMEKKYNALEKDFITAKVRFFAKNLIFLRYFIPYFYSIIGRKMTRILKN